MTHPYSVSAPYAVNTNFKIQADGYLSKPVGRFVEELMAAVNTYRAACGMAVWQFYLYDRYTGPKSLHEGWTADVDTDTQRKTFTPSADADQLAPYDAYVANYIQDIAKALNANDVTNPLSASHGLLKLLNMDGGEGNSAQVDLTIDQLMTDSAPDLDAHLNMLRPKLGVACLVADAVEVYDVFSAVLAGGNVDGENRLSRFYLRDQNGAKLDGATALYAPAGGDLYVCFGATLRRFDGWGGSVRINGGAYTQVLDQAPDDFFIAGDFIFYVSGGLYYTAELESAGSDEEIVVNLGDPVTGFTGVADGSFFQGPIKDGVVYNVDVDGIIQFALDLGGAERFRSVGRPVPLAYYYSAPGGTDFNVDERDAAGLAVTDSGVSLIGFHTLTQVDTYDPWATFFDGEETGFDANGGSGVWANFTDEGGGHESTQHNGRLVVFDAEAIEDDPGTLAMTLAVIFDATILTGGTTYTLELCPYSGPLPPVDGGVFGDDLGPPIWSRECDAGVEEGGWVEAKIDVPLSAVREDGKIALMARMNPLFDAALASFLGGYPSVVADSLYIDGEK